MRYEMSGKNIKAYIDFTNVYFILKNVVQRKSKKFGGTKVNISSYSMDNVLDTLHKGKIRRKSKNVFEIDKRGNDFIFVVSIPYNSRVQYRRTQIIGITPSKEKLPLAVTIRRNIIVYGINDEVAIIEAKKEQLPILVKFYVKEQLWNKDPEKKYVVVKLKGYNKNESLQAEYNEASLEDKSIDNER